ncbi:MAG: hypothetical protein K0U53_05945 [Betaproteobacteria bacterium]|jgi:hypothetical protein|nr:hypothetical protein [Betaproteobacteria bacterium]
MSNLELAKSIRNGMFADRGVDLEEAYNYAFSLMRNDPAVLTGMMVVLNTLSNVIIENEKETA